MRADRRSDRQQSSHPFILPHAHHHLNSEPAHTYNNNTCTQVHILVPLTTTRPLRSPPIQHPDDPTRPAHTLTLDPSPVHLSPPSVPLSLQSNPHPSHRQPHPSSQNRCPTSPQLTPHPFLESPCPCPYPHPGEKSTSVPPHNPYTTPLLRPRRTQAMPRPFFRLSLPLAPTASHPTRANYTFLRAQHAPSTPAEQGKRNTRPLGSPPQAHRNENKVRKTVVPEQEKERGERSG